MDKEKYKEIQDQKSEQDFKYNTLQRIQDLEFSITKMKGSMQNLDAVLGHGLKGCEVDIDHVMQSCMDSLKEFRSSIDSCEKTASDSRSLFNMLYTEMKECITKQECEDKLKGLRQEIQSLRKEKESMRRDFDASLQRLYSDFDARLKATKDEILSIPSEVPNLRKLVDQKIELVELNGQNAVLRSSNNEKEIMLVERKIDNLYQLVKRLELSIQETK